MRRQPKELFIFDLDGTLADTYTAIERSLNFTRESLGLRRVSFSTVKKSVGHGDRIFIETFSPPAQVEKALRIYRRHHQKSLKVYSYPRPFARYLLYCLKRKGKRIAVASNRPTRFTRIVVKATGLEKYLDYILCADRVGAIKPSPKILKAIMRKFSIPQSLTVYIGDMAIDLETARRAGVDAVFVKGGSGTAKEARKFKGVKIVSSLKEVKEIYA